MASVEVQHYRNRAKDFLDGMKFLQEDLDAFGYSSALLGIHGAISYADALRAGMGSKKLSAGDHSRAADDLKSLLDSNRFDRQQGVKHFRMLLTLKSKISYAAQTVRKNEFEDVVKRAMRFADWAEGTGKALKIEGW
ncbi:MAG: hypothetical protein ABSE51_07345 [Terracidiphilus sp.]|jgi:hypothetical protein